MLLEMICNALLLENDYVKSVISSASKRYKTFFILKKNGIDKREINTPSRELKALQKFILDNIFDSIPTHKCATAYKVGLSIKENVQPHSKNKFILGMDLQDFFHSITMHDFKKFARSRESPFQNYIPEDIEILCKIAFRYHRLSQGAVTSPVISNILCYEMDKKIYGMCEAEGVAYTRYADDMTFSSNKPNILFSIEDKVKEIINLLEFPIGLKINTNKTFHASKKRNITRTGLVITCDGHISIGRQKKKEVKSKIHRWDSLDDDVKKHLSGYLCYIKGVEPIFINNLYIKYGAEKIDKVFKFNN